MTTSSSAQKTGSSPQREEDEFEEVVDELAAQEIVSGLLGEAVITDVWNAGGEWNFELKMPDTTKAVLKLTANPSSKTDELFAFLKTVGVYKADILDVQYQTIPVVLDGTEWKPIFPSKNTSTAHAVFRNVIWAARNGLAMTRSDEIGTVLGLKSWPRVVYSGLMGLILFFTVFVAGFALVRFAPYLLIAIVAGGLWIIQKGTRVSYTAFDTTLREVTHTDVNSKRES